ncbi:MAG: type VI secretion system baseplate subunit TssF [Puniceicoccales bacterium]
MTPEFLRYYNQELDHLRHVAAEFAREHPKIAGRLALPQDAREYCPDPYVERMLEGFAFMAARVQHKIDAEFPQFTEALLESVFPDFLCPIPSTTIVEYQPNLTEIDPVKGFNIPRLSTLRSRIPESATTPCIYRTAHNVHLWPIQLVEAEYHVRDIAALRLPKRAKAALRLTFETAAGVEVENLRLNELVLHNRGVGDLPGLLYELLLTRCDSVSIRSKTDKGTTTRMIDGTKISPVGFSRDEAMLPPTARGFDGYRLLREFFCLPQRLMFWKVAGLKDAFSGWQGNRFDLIFGFDHLAMDLEERVEKSAFGLFSTPAINLFPKSCDRVPMSGRFNEYQLIVDRTRPLEFEIYRVEEATAIDTDTNADMPLSPFYRFRGRDHDVPAYYQLHRRDRGKTVREKNYVTGRSYLGTEVYISLSDPSAPPFNSRYDQIATKVLCTNRHLPNVFPRGLGLTDFYTDVAAPITGVRCLLKPTQPYAPPPAGEVNWQFINNLSANFFSFLNFESHEAAAFLRQTLLLYVMPNDQQARKEIAGLEAIAAKAAVRQIPTDEHPALARGMEVKLTLNPESFAASNAFVFGSVIENYLARGASINSFIETSYHTPAEGEIWRWPARTGARSLL